MCGRGDGAAAFLFCFCLLGIVGFAKEEELWQLREQVAQLRAENEQLSQARDVSQAGPSRADPISIAAGGDPPVAGTGPLVTERLIVLPRAVGAP